MGRSAKLHKRVKRKAATTGPAAAAPKTARAPANQSASAKRRSGLTTKAAPPDGKQGHVLGGADYVELMMGSRKRAREEAAKLPS